MSSVTVDRFIDGEPVDYRGATGAFQAQYRRYPLGHLRIITTRGRIIASTFMDERAARSFFATLKKGSP